MVYSSTSNPELMSRSMRAGAREFLTDIIPNAVIQDALFRAAARRSLQNKRVSGEAFVFWGAKGGSGVTTIATNFALALRMETAAGVALIDLNCRMGDVGVLLGISPRFTVMEALNNAKRLDQELIAPLFTEHRSGLNVLAAPDAYDPSVVIEPRAVGKLLNVVRDQYAYAVVDAAHLGNAGQALLETAKTIYLVTQLDIPSLRNAQRMVSYMRGAGHSNIELVINRHDARKSDIDDAQVFKAVGLHPKWKLPNDYAAARRASNVGSPLIYEKSAASAGIRAMARAATGKSDVIEKRKGLGLFGL
jgi:pilus assembly protein CpaE